MIGMKSAAKLKVSLTLSADLLALVDRDARRRQDTRSGVVEQWLRRAAAAHVEREIEEATATYYRSLRGDESAEEETLSKALSVAARRVSYDDSESPRRRLAKR
jgi:metal-responsive CopG/Arc/MetJ family transcriptional regulator